MIKFTTCKKYLFWNLDLNLNLQLQTNNMIPCHPKNTNCSNYKINILFAWIQRTSSGWTEMMTQRNKRTDDHFQGSKTRRKNEAITWSDNKKANDMVTQTWIIEDMKMYKISKYVINCLTEAMENWYVELTFGGQAFAVVKIQSWIFQGDSFSPLLSFIAMMLLNYILRKCTGGYKFTKRKDKPFNVYIWYEYNCQNKKVGKTGVSDTNNKNIEPEYRMGFRIEKCAMPIFKKEENRSNGRNRTAKIRKTSEHLKKKEITSTWEY